MIVAAEADGTLYAGVDPGVLFESRDGGRAGSSTARLEAPHEAEVVPAAGGLCLHSIATWPGEPGRLAVGISAAGVWLTDDGGATWRSGNAGIVPRYLPEGVPMTRSASACTASSARRRSRSGSSCSSTAALLPDDAGESWHDIARGLPSDSDSRSRSTLPTRPARM